MEDSCGRDERGRLQPDVSPALGQDGVWSAPEPPKRPADDEWMAFASEDPAFFIKLSDTAYGSEGYSSDLGPLSNRR
jgi:hypothetical protein